MKHLLTVVFASIACLALPGAYAQSDIHLVTWSCNPDSCQDNDYFTWGSSVQVSISGICDNGNAPYASGGVYALGCLYAVNLFSYGWPAISSSPGIDNVNAGAYATLFFSGDEYYFMWDTQYCDYYESFYAAPPSPC